MVRHPAEYSFSSYQYYAYGKPDSLLTHSPVYLGLSDCACSRRKQYVDFVVDGRIISSELLAKKLYIGSPAFIAKLQEYYRIKNRREVRGRPPKEIK